MSPSRSDCYVVREGLTFELCDCSETLPYLASLQLDFLLCGHVPCSLQIGM